METKNASTTTTKESAEYNTRDMTFFAHGLKCAITLPMPDYDENDGKAVMARKLLLVGARNVIIDSVASMTIKAGYTEKQRSDKRAEVLDAINAGKTVEKKAKDTVSLAALTSATDPTALSQILGLVKLGLLGNFKFSLNQIDIMKDAEIIDDEDYAERLAALKAAK